MDAIEVIKEALWFEEAFLKLGCSPEVAKLAYKIHINNSFGILINPNTDSIIQNNY